MLNLRRFGVDSMRNATGQNSPPYKEPVRPLTEGVLPVYREGGGWTFFLFLFHYINFVAKRLAC